MIKKLSLILLFLAVNLLASFAHAEWSGATGNLPETDVQALASDPFRPGIWYAGSGKQLFKTMDSGLTWKRVLSLRGTEKAIHCLYVDSIRASVVYAGTTDGVRRSVDGGKHWEKFYQNGLGPKNVYWIAKGAEGDTLWLGTDKGLISVPMAEPSKASVLPGSPDVAVYAILVRPSEATKAYLNTEKGIYALKADGWALVHSAFRKEGSEAPTTLENFNVEEMTVIPMFSNIIMNPVSGSLIAGTPQGLVESKDGESWSLMEGQTLAGQKIRSLAASSDSFYSAGDKGVFRWEQDEKLLRPASEGLVELETRILLYNAAEDCLLAGTKNGLFRWSHPDFNGLKEVETAPKEEKTPAPATPEAKEFLKRFDSEPSIRQVQEAAVTYAEVHPNKILEWRRAAARKAILPNVSVNGGIDTNENVDLDRGGTGDPDHFIIGPRERSFDWSVGLSWDLGDLIWSDDQTSIDTRSKLMAELRDDVLNEVTHLYYERRRLQAEMAMSASKDLPVWVEKEIRLEELTAGIDALTGGMMTDQLANRFNVASGGPK